MGYVVRPMGTGSSIRQGSVPRVNISTASTFKQGTPIRDPIDYFRYNTSCTTQIENDLLRDPLRRSRATT